MTTVRSACDDDHQTAARLFGELATGDPPFSRERWAREMAAESRVAELDGRVVGYVFAQPLDGIGYVRHLAVDPAMRRRGVARALLVDTADRFLEAGASSWCLNVKPDNVAAIALYEGLGMRASHHGWGVELAWSCLDAWPPSPGDASIAVRRIEPDEAAAWEASFAIASGLLARGLAAGRVVVGAEAQGERIGLACFDPSFPGSSPFAASSPAAARALLAAMHPHKRPEHDTLKLFIERDASIHAALIDRGGRTTLDALHLRGPLPIPRG